MRALSTIIALCISVGPGFGQSDPGAGISLEKYRTALQINPSSSLAHYRIAEIYFQQKNYQSAANEFREALNGDLQPDGLKPFRTSVWALFSTFPASLTVRRTNIAWRRLSIRPARESPITASLLKASSLSRHNLSRKPSPSIRTRRGWPGSKARFAYPARSLSKVYRRTCASPSRWASA